MIKISGTIVVLSSSTKQLGASLCSQREDGGPMQRHTSVSCSSKVCLNTTIDLFSPVLLNLSY